MSIFDQKYRKTIRGQAISSGFTFCLLIAVLGCSSVIGSWYVSSLIKTQADVSNINIDIVNPLTTTAFDIQLDVAQVQQWLTDISATRGHDGLNDGFDVAESYAKKFADHTAQAIVLSRQLNNTKLIRMIEQTQKAFPAYYEMGKNMAKAYVENGPEGGNKIMGKFDKTAERINKNVEKILSETDKISQTLKNEIHDTTGQTSDAGQIVILLGLIISAIAIVISVLQTRASVAAAELITIGSSALKAASRGDLSQRVTGIRRDDEIGALILNLNRLLDLYEAFSKEAAAAIDYAGQRKYYRKIAVRGLRGELVSYAKRINEVIDGMEVRRQATRAFAEDDVSTAIEFVARESSALNEKAKGMAEVAAETIERSVAVASVAEQTMANVQTVASASEELSASIGEINRQTSEASKVASEAVAEVAQTNQTVATLGEAAQKIGEVVQIIQDIADQTNLLALNATIEAARAGEAGKGFAVVASEVKNLANQTSRATEEIGLQVNSMQVITSEAVTAIGKIGDIIARMNENVENVVGAVEEQNAATSEISSNVQEAAAGTQDVSAKISGVSSDAESTNHTAQQVLETASVLQGKSDELKSAMDKFMGNLG